MLGMRVVNLSKTVLYSYAIIGGFRFCQQERLGRFDE